MKNKVFLMALFSILFLTACASLSKKDVLEHGKFGVGVLASLAAHQAWHIAAAEIRGYDWKIFWNSRIVPNEHINGKRPDPFVYGAGIGTEMIIDEFLFLMIESEKRDSFWYGYMFASTWDQLNYCRRGIFGDGSTDLSREKFGGYRKAAGTISGIHSAYNAYRLSQDPKIREKVKKWYQKIKIILEGNSVEAQLEF